jgi:hypothetical protein
LKFKAPVASVLITMGPESRIQLLFVFDYKEILSKFTFAICSIPNFSLVYRQKTKNTVS